MMECVIQCGSQWSSMAQRNKKETCRVQSKYISVGKHSGPLKRQRLKNGSPVVICWYCSSCFRCFCRGEESRAEERRKTSFCLINWGLCQMPTGYRCCFLYGWKMRKQEKMGGECLKKKGGDWRVQSRRQDCWSEKRGQWLIEERSNIDKVIQRRGMEEGCWFWAVLTHLGVKGVCVSMHTCVHTVFLLKVRMTMYHHINMLQHVFRYFL